jgi:hypothetical protein
VKFCTKRFRGNAADIVVQCRHDLGGCSSRGKWARFWRVFKSSPADGSLDIHRKEVEGRCRTCPFSYWQYAIKHVARSSAAIAIPGTRDVIGTIVRCGAAAVLLDARLIYADIFIAEPLTASLCLT